MGSASGAHPTESVMTVTGAVPAREMGMTLVHEHILSRFGPPPEEPGRYDRAQVLREVVPYLDYIKSLGCQTIVDCTAAYFGRNVALLEAISEQTGLHVLTNTGIYGAAGDDYIPGYAHKETAQQLALRWIDEFQNGIQGTDVKPGFVKIGVDPGPLSDIDAKLVRAAALTHLETGLLLQIHTSDNPDAANQQLQILKEEGVAPSAWVWVHAHNVDNANKLLEAAERGAWISLDGLRTPNYLNGFGDSSSTVMHHLELMNAFKSEGLLNRVLLSHDGSTYPPEGVAKRPLDVLSNTFIPVLKAAGFTQEEINQVTHKNPATAFSVKVRTL
ncbi:phosphotriesterase [Halalkalibaculum sp. DA384]|uniref:phosphotriesterase family protein n=1 Tax=Halalkalibaculum sp. DA384 TaxID=3373606 RepID=UPI00375439C9